MNPKIAAVINSELPPEEAEKVIDALKAITVDPAVGTVLRNPVTGDVAVYVHQYAEMYWRIYSVDDRTWIEKEPLVGWDVLHQEASAEAKPAPASRKRAAK